MRIQQGIVGDEERNGLLGRNRTHIASRINCHTVLIDLDQECLGHVTGASVADDVEKLTQCANRNIGNDQVGQLLDSHGESSVVGAARIIRDQVICRRRLRRHKSGADWIDLVLIKEHQIRIDDAPA